MKLKEINEFSHYQRIVDSYKRKGYLTNDYLYNEVRELISQERLYECCGVNNAFLFVKKEECQRLYYYLNDLTEKHDFDLDENLVVEILFRGNIGTPDDEIEYLKKNGFDSFLRRDQYSAMYKDLAVSEEVEEVVVEVAKSIDLVEWACLFFNATFDHYTGDYISCEEYQTILDDGNMLIASSPSGEKLGALHQTINKGVATLSHVAVIPEARGNHVGQALLNAFIELNHVDEKSRYMLWVQAQNVPAVRMYQKKGFKYVGKSTISMLKLK